MATRQGIPNQTRGEDALCKPHSNYYTLMYNIVSHVANVDEK